MDDRLLALTHQLAAAPADAELRTAATALEFAEQTVLECRTTLTEEHLAEALDYRRWHRFWVLRKQDSGWRKLTKRTHGTGSGGEKAVALTEAVFLTRWVWIGKQLIRDNVPLPPAAHLDH